MDVSVIIPIYNSEKYLHRCLHSLVIQNNIDCEFLCIDDGSTDRSESIIRSFSAIDNRFRYFYINHRGTSSARNEGLVHASGKYICFLDSDDYFKKNALHALFKLAEQYDCDTIKFNAKIVHGQSWMKNAFMKHNEFINNFTERDIFLHKDCRPFVWCHFIKHDILDEQRFDVSLQIGEDQEFIIRYLRHVKSVLFISKNYYIHYNRAESIMNKCSTDQICFENLKLVKKVSSFLTDKSDLYKTWVLDTLYYSFIKSNKTQELRSAISYLIDQEGINQLTNNDCIAKLKEFDLK